MVQLNRLCPDRPAALRLAERTVGRPRTSITLREALVLAVDFLRGSGTEDPALLLAAKKLERKAEKLRARLETPAFWPAWCECGDRKPIGAQFCHPCQMAFPPKVVQAFHLGTAKQSAKARARMLRISRNRLHTAAGREAA